ncbi:MAG: hypothetical protein FJX59_08660 [Alphaproteobacteria bacterium]|nr:hypothetical protein [Alphaproteobacteria bacterium]
MMIGELWRYWTTFAPERVRAYGYLSRLIALEFRAKRCQAAWAPHQQRCREKIVKVAALAAGRDVCVVVGSGLLLEVPIEALADTFKRTYLVDIFHLPQVRRQVRPFKDRVTLLTGDVTGIFAAIKDGQPPGPHIPAPAARIPHLAEADLAISCNCLTQLAGPFVAAFEKTPTFSDLDADRLAFQIMQNHAHAFAAEAKGIGLIISDIERHVLKGTHAVERIDLLKAMKLPPTAHLLHNEEWTWRIAPRGEEFPDRDVEHIVEAKVYERTAPAAVSEPPADDGLEAVAATGRFAAS